MAAPCLVTGKVQDEGGNLATTGTVDFILQPYATSLPYRVVGTSINAPIKVTLPLTSSTVNLSGTVWGNDQITPIGTTYQVIFKPTGATSQVWNNVYIFGSTYDLDSPTFAPPAVVNAAIVVPTATVPNNLMPAADNAFNIGSQALRWATINGVLVTASTVQANTVTANTVNAGSLTGSMTFAGPSPWTDVTAYGAKGDLKYVHDAAVTSGSNVLTSATAGFSSVDIGKILVVGGGSPTAYIFGSITAVTSGSTATMSTAATVTATSQTAWWGTDNRSAIQSAINACMGNTSYIFVPPGMYGVTSGLTLSNTQQLRFYGCGSAVSSLFNLSSGGNVLLVTTGVIAPWIGTQVCGLTFIGNGGGNECGVKQVNSTGVVYDDICVRDFWGAASAGMWFDNEAGYFSERTTWRKISFFNNKISLRFTVTGGTSSFLYSRMTECHFQLFHDQIGISVEPGATLANSSYSFFYNGDGGVNETVVSATGNFSNNHVVMFGEAITGAGSKVIVVGASGAFTAVGAVFVATSDVLVTPGGAFGYAGNMLGMGNYHMGVFTALGQYLVAGAGGMTILTLSSGQNDDVDLAGSSFAQISGPGSAYSITGFKAGQGGRKVLLWNPSSGLQLTIKNSTGSQAANQIFTMTAADVVLTATNPHGNIVEFIYNDNVNRWLLTSFL